MHKWHWAAAIGATLLIIYSSLRSTSDIPGPNILHLDKILHMGAYAVLTLLWLRVALWETGFTLYAKGHPQARNTMFIKIGVTILLFSGSMEVAQGLVSTGRSMDAFDLAANAAGIAFAILLVRRAMSTTHGIFRLPLHWM